MATPKYNTYVGMRYVPIFDGEWDRTKTYEPLVIVSYQGNSYTSKTFVPSNIEITNETYWALTGNYNAQVEYYRQETQRVEDAINYFLIPDVHYEGSDTVKLQSCLDELSTTGGIILINRKYTLTDNLVNKLKTDATNKKSILFLGGGKEALIDMGQYSFISDDSDASVGGLHFMNMDFEGTANFANTNKLIRLFFNNCRFRGFDYVIYGQGVTQSIYFEQCYFEDIGDWVIGNISNGVWDIKMHQCIVENSAGVYHGDLANQGNGNYGVAIEQCCIEGITNSAITPSGNMSSLIIANNYFESCQPIDLTRCGGNNASGIAVENNVFILSNNVSAIHMPVSNSADKYHGHIENNVCTPSTATLCSMDGNPSYKCRYQIVNNVGVIDDNNKYAKYIPVYGEVLEFTESGLSVAANSNYVVDSSRNYLNAISITLIRAGHAGDFYNPGTFAYVHSSNQKLMIHVGENAMTSYKIAVIMPTDK